jgi:hypothetical protein
MAQRSLAESVAGLFAIVAFFSIFGLVAGGFMFRDAARDRSTAAETPQAIALADLLTHGPGDNAHVTVSRFEVGRDYVVLNGSERLTFLILRPRDPVPNTAQQILMVENRYLENASEVDSFCRRPTITGIYFPNGSIRPIANPAGCWKRNTPDLTSGTRLSSRSENFAVTGTISVPLPLPKSPARYLFCAFSAPYSSPGSQSDKSAK